MPPPTRFAYPYAAHLWQGITGENSTGRQALPRRLGVPALMAAPDRPYWPILYAVSIFTMVITK